MKARDILNLIIGEVFRLLPPQSTTIPIVPKHLACVSQLISDEKISSSQGKSLIKILWEEDQDPISYIDQKNLWQINDSEKLYTIITQTLNKNPPLVNTYQQGKTNAAKALMGKAMALSKGKGNPVILKELLNKVLKEL